MHVFNEAGNNSIAGNFTLVTGGGDTRLVVNAGTLTVSGTFTSGATNRGLVLAGVGGGTLSGTIQDGTGANVLARFDKVDAGTWTLSGNVTHTGATNIYAGTLVLNGGITASSGVTVANGATLAGVGNIAAPTTVNGVHNPGNAYGTQTFGSLNYSATAQLKWELAGNAIGIGSFDKVSASGTVTIASGAVVDVVLNRSDSTVDLTNAFWSQNRSWQIASAGSLSGTFALGTVSADKAGHIASDYGTFSLQQTATSVVLNWTVYTPTELWQRANFGPNWTNPATASDSVDPDGDGYSNLIERALNGDPNVASLFLAQTSIIGGRLAVTFVRNIANTDLTITVQAADSPDGPWTDIARSTNGAAFAVLAAGASGNETGAGSTRNVEVRDIYSINDPLHLLRFMRIQVLH